MTTKNRKQLLIINIILICLILNMVATISEMVSYDQVGEVGIEAVQLNQSNS